MPNPKHVNRQREEEAAEALPSAPSWINLGSGWSMIDMEEAVADLEAMGFTREETIAGIDLHRRAGRLEDNRQPDGHVLLEPTPVMWAWWEEQKRPKDEMICGYRKIPDRWEVFQGEGMPYEALKLVRVAWPPGSQWIEFLKQPQLPYTEYFQFHKDQVAANNFFLRKKYPLRIKSRDEGEYQLTPEPPKNPPKKKPSKRRTKGKR